MTVTTIWVFGAIIVAVAIVLEIVEHHQVSRRGGLHCLALSNQTRPAPECEAATPGCDVADRDKTLNQGSLRSSAA